jgi:ferrous iron transport protein B
MRESGSWKWALGQFVFMSGFAYIAALVIFQTGKLIGLP